MAEIPSALKPIASDSPRATTPRTIGTRSQRCRLSTEISGNDWTSISPAASPASRPSWRVELVGAGMRTATAQVEMPRIITPSRTAWPPTGASRVARAAGGASPRHRRLVATLTMCPSEGAQVGCA